jgi:hypothetical protein
VNLRTRVGLAGGAIVLGTLMTFEGIPYRVYATPLTDDPGTLVRVAQALTAEQRRCYPEGPALLPRRARTRGSPFAAVVSSGRLLGAGCRG